MKVSTYIGTTSSLLSSASSVGAYDSTPTVTTVTVSREYIEMLRHEEHWGNGRVGFDAESKHPTNSDRWSCSWKTIASMNGAKR